jgi:hypothetical protein
MPQLCLYGTLQPEQVQVETFGRKLASNPDILLGFKAHTFASGEINIL